MPDTPAQPVSQQEADRRAKLERLREEFGIDPYGRRIDGLVPVATARARYDADADEAHKQEAARDARPRVRVAGRVVLRRDIGKLIFMTVREAGTDLQLAVSRKMLTPETFKLAKLTDLGDIVVAAGPLGTTRTGEITLWAEEETETEAPGASAAAPAFRIATKSLAPPPEKWLGLRDPEQRYRRRYVDLYANPEAMKTLTLRSRLIQAVRRFLTDPPEELGPGYLEVETPMMQPVAGGAAARPFITHHNALDIDLFLRIAPELYLKRLLVGGMPRVFEINRNFRNEGLSPRHNPEFTMLELYQAFGDYGTMMDLTERLLHELAVSVSGEAAAPELPFGEASITYRLPFARRRYHELFAEVNGFEGADRQRLLERARSLHVEAPEAKDPDLLLQEVWEATVEPTLVQPTFVYDYPAALCPLTRRQTGNPEIAERFELYIAGMEIANAYSELNDPDVQAANFERQLGGVDDDEATFRTLDTDFLDALKVGMPPAGGLGIGIDRLVMLLTDQRSIRDVILFPLMKPEGGGEGASG